MNGPESMRVARHLADLDPGALVYREDQREYRRHKISSRTDPSRFAAGVHRVVSAVASRICPPCMVDVVRLRLKVAGLPGTQPSVVLFVAEEGGDQ